MPVKANDTYDKTRRLQRQLYRAAKRSRTRRFHAVYDKVHRRDVLERAWSQVRGNRGTAGIDGQTIEDIEARGVDEFLDQLQRELQAGNYRPQALRRVWIPKRQGGQRPLGIPAVRDRVVQAAARLVLEPIFEADLGECSYGFRPKRSAYQARERIRQAIQAQQCRWVVDADIEGFFDHIDHDMLLRLLRRRLSDRRMLHLLGGWLKAGVLEGTMLLHPQAGTPQGGVISPLLANVYLHALDKMWERHYHRLGKLVRYADDLVILTWQGWQAEKALQILGEALGRLGLKLSATKTSVVHLARADTGFDFLGYHFRWIPVAQNPRRHFCACWPSRKAMQAARDRIRDLTPLHRVGLPISQVVGDLNRFLHGGAAYFRHGNATPQFKTLDRYVTDRLCRFIARKHGKPGVRRGLSVLLSSHTHLGLTSITGTVEYPSVNAVR